MSDYDFDRVIDRRDTSSLKWDLFDETVIPLWVADMDFCASDEIIKALTDRVNHGVFGYTHTPDELLDVIVAHLDTAHGWTIDRSWIVFIPGVVSCLNLCCRTVVKPGNKILVPEPVYPPFFEAPPLSGKAMEILPMITTHGRLTFDWDALDLADHSETDLFLLCSPHNPGGTVFTQDELDRLAHWATTHDVMICSDEIHCDLVFDGIHRPTAAACPQIKDRVITLMAPSKTYNIPGLGVSFAIISDPKVRESFENTAKDIVPHVNTLGYTAALAAYKYGGTWLREVLDYLDVNRKLVHKRINGFKNMSCLLPEASYLTWIDARKTGLDDPANFFKHAGVGLSDGRYFGRKGFLRLNFGCRRALLEEALDRMEQALLRL